MIKKSIKYLDFNGVERKEDFFFHLSLPEVTRLQASVSPETFEEHLLRISKEGDEALVLQMLEKIVLGAYGIKSRDGKSFIKTEEDTRNFEYSQAYAELFEELLVKPDEMTKFAKGIGAMQKAANQPADWKTMLAKNEE